jgi:transposase
MSYTESMWTQAYEQIVWLYREGYSIDEISGRMDLSEMVIMAIVEKYLEKA